MHLLGFVFKHGTLHSFVCFPWRGAMLTFSIPVLVYVLLMSTTEQNLNWWIMCSPGWPCILILCPLHPTRGSHYRQAPCCPLNCLPVTSWHLQAGWCPSCYPYTSWWMFGLLPLRGRSGWHGVSSWSRWCVPGNGIGRISSCMLCGPFLGLAAFSLTPVISYLDCVFCVLLSQSCIF